MRRLILRAVIGACLPVGSVAYGQDQAVAVPAIYEAGHFYATPALPNGQRLRLLVDTGGAGGSGLYVLWRQVVRRLQLPVSDCVADGQHLDVVRDGAFADHRSLPRVDAIRPCDAAAIVIAGSVPDADGMLGAGYLPHFIWTFDYPRQRLFVEPADWRAPASMTAVPLHFPHAHGKPTSGFARVTLAIDGSEVDLLLDTGATAFPTPIGEAVAHTPTVRGEGVTSYIVTSLLEAWHRRHPGWQVVDKGDHFSGGMRLIEVPQVALGPYSIGPIWFTERPDRNFGVDGMSQWMDRPVQGAVGANILGRFRLTLDYPQETLWLDRQ